MPSTVRLNHKQQCGSGRAMNKKAPVSGAFCFDRAHAYSARLKAVARMPHTYALDRLVPLVLQSIAVKFL